MLTDISSGNTVTNNLDLEEINSDITEELGEALALIYKLLFKSRKLLSLNYLFNILLEEKLIKDVSSGTKARYWTSFTEHNELFTTTYFLDQPAIGLREWIPLIRKPKRKLSQNILQNIKNVTIGQSEKKHAEILKYQHKLSNEEINDSFLVMSQDLLRLFNNPGTGFQITIYCYGDYSFNAWINTEFYTLHAPELKRFYKDNKLNPGDIVYTEKRMDDVTGIHLYTIWQINVDNSTNEKEKNESKQSKSDRNKNINDDAKQNKKDSDYDAVYLLSLIQNKDLVYKFVKSNGPSMVSDIIKALSKELAVEKEKIARLSLIDFSDTRIIRLPDGRIVLKEILRKNIYNQPKKIHSVNNLLVYILILIILIILAIVL